MSSHGVTVKMPGWDPRLIVHALNVDLEAKPVA